MIIIMGEERGKVRFSIDLHSIRFLRQSERKKERKKRREDPWGRQLFIIENKKKNTCILIWKSLSFCLSLSLSFFLSFSFIEASNVKPSLSPLFGFGLHLGCFKWIFGKNTYLFESRFRCDPENE